MQILPDDLVREKVWSEPTKNRTGELLGRLVHEIFHSVQEKWKHQNG